MDSKQLKFMIIENFVNHWTTAPDIRDIMMDTAHAYVEEDHVDEITQAGWIDPKIPIGETITDVERKIAYIKSVIERNDTCYVANLPDWEEVPLSGVVTKEHVMVARITYYGPECNNYIGNNYIDSWDMGWDDCNDDEIDQVYKIISHYDTHIKVVAHRKALTKYINGVISEHGEFSAGEIGANAIIYKELDDTKHLIERYMPESVRVVCYIKDIEIDCYDLKLTQLPLDILEEVQHIVEEYEADRLLTEKRISN